MEEEIGFSFNYDQVKDRYKSFGGDRIDSVVIDEERHPDQMELLFLQLFFHSADMEKAYPIEILVELRNNLPYNVIIFEFIAFTDIKDGGHVPLSKSAE